MAIHRRAQLMNKLTSKNLRIIRNIIMISGMIAAFILWFFIPSFIRNSPQVHVGNGAYGSRLGFLLLLPLPLLGLIPHKQDDGEIHTDNARARAMLEEERNTEELKTQIAMAVFGIISACLCILAGILMG